MRSKMVPRFTVSFITVTGKSAHISFRAMSTKSRLGEVTLNELLVILAFHTAAKK